MNVTDVKQYFSDSKEYEDINGAQIVDALSKAITYKTVSYEDVSLMDGEAFRELHRHFEEAFPLVHKNMKKMVINDWSLVYHWVGSDPSLKPALFMSHLDVVPVMPGTEDDWKQPAFSGAILDDFIWGRGTIDTKSQVIGELYAAEYLMEKGCSPKRDIYFVFGHDEETMGVDGSLAAMHYLKEKGVRLEFVMDEGGGFRMGSKFGAPNALLAEIDIFEKGYIDVIVEANDAGGHSSRPGKGTSLGKVAKAIGKIEDSQLSSHINEVVFGMFQKLGDVITEEPFKTYVKNIEEKPDEFAKFLCEDRNLAPLVHTTTALTMINGSPAPNVLPGKVSALINFRIAPEDSCASILEHCKKVVDDSTVSIYMSKGMEPSKISKIDSVGYQAMENAVAKFFDRATLVPGLVTGGTDCRYFEEICDHCYRFRPYIDNMVLGNTVHATDERCYIPALLQGIKGIIDIMKKSCF